ncbi:acyltransferase family protein [Microbacterium dauci]|uniref:Acyltransferase family protein n=1 Tax=Microbacterium dauci TaxID=3048008 RepID=A0ABT6ZE93_9MICO|nr:acyltransferase family protein [Microbacterium sp. LX3-4]MDJ1114489.1 acyltransferase family protein [Microbacterium sp. LX3-4]
MSRATSTTDTHRGGFRDDIQALRALAVVLVVVYHFWPGGALQGGYVGVDVFFVISGYLITRHLVTGLSGGTLTLRRFWARRIRRLLPAALLVICVTVVATLLIAPVSMWQQTMVEAIGSTFSLQNVVLMLNSVDYLAEGANPSPLQHYWSLSVEEQFYLVWPVLLLAAIALGRRWGRRSVVTVAIVAVTVVSFAASLVVTEVSASIAYFIPVTRAWEFGVGALVALAPRLLADRLGGGIRATIAVAGLAAIVLAAFVFDAATPFPGAAAALPVLGTAAVIAAADTSGPTAILARIPAVQFLGRVSYSLYLWHWPLVVLLDIGVRTLGVTLPPLVQGAVLVVPALVLAWASKRWIEDRFLEPKGDTATTRRSFAVAGVAASAVATLAVAGMLMSTATVADAQQRFTAAIDGGACVGAAAQPGCAPTEVIAPAVLARDDLPSTYAGGCQAGPRQAELETCVLGDADAETTIAVVGDSHAASWIPALETIAEDRGWRIHTYLKSSCAWATDAGNGDALQRSSCEAWNDDLGETLTEADYDAVITSYFAPTELSDADTEARAAGLAEAWTPVAEAGTPVVAIEDTPRLTDDAADCVFASRRDPEACTGPVHVDDSSAETLQVASEAVDGTSVIDLDAAFLDDQDRVNIVEGGLVLWRDSHHFTATFSSSLAEDVEAALTGADVLPAAG